LDELPEHQREVVLFALATGLRQGNVLKLEWSQINLKQQHAWIHAAEGQIPGAGLYVPGKPFNSANTHAWKQALKRAGIDNFRWHELRHTWATWQRQAGTPTHELQRLGGWRRGVW
jgi:integrase